MLFQLRSRRAWFCSGRLCLSEQACCVASSAPRNYEFREGWLYHGQPSFFAQKGILRDLLSALNTYVDLKLLPCPCKMTPKRFQCSGEWFSVVSLKKYLA